MLRRSASSRPKRWLLALLIVGAASTASAPARRVGADDRVGRQKSGRLPGKPAYLWLWYADGGPLPENEQTCGGLHPPAAYQCAFGTSVRDCQAQVQAYLDDWYKDFNLLFTLTRPPSGDYYTLVIANGWPACAQAAAEVTNGVPVDEAGIAAGNCNDNPGLAAIAIECGRSALACATIIAHEHGHLVGLEHTSSKTDVMNATVLTTAAGFDDQSNVTVNALCESKQNSYRQMLTALGAWPGGAKPDPFTPTGDAGAGDAAKAGDAADAAAGIDAFSGGSAGPGTSPDSDASVIFVGGEDALVRPPIPRVDAATGNPGARSGCMLSARGDSRSASTFAVLLVIVVGGALGRARHRR